MGPILEDSQMGDVIRRTVLQPEKMAIRRTVG